MEVVFLVEDESVATKLGLAEGEACPMNLLMQDLLPSWPVVDDKGDKDTINIPEIAFQIRFKLKVQIELLTHPEIPEIVFMVR